LPTADNQGCPQERNLLSFLRLQDILTFAYPNTPYACILNPAANKGRIRSG